MAKIQIDQFPLVSEPSPGGLLHTADSQGLNFKCPVEFISNSSNIFYDNFLSEIPADNVQDAIDFLVEQGPPTESGLSSAYYQEVEPATFTVGPSGDFQELSTAIRHVAAFRSQNKLRPTDAPDGSPLITLEIAPEYVWASPIVCVAIDLSHIKIKTQGSGLIQANAFNISISSDTYAFQCINGARSPKFEIIFKYPNQSINSGAFKAAGHGSLITCSNVFIIDLDANPFNGVATSATLGGCVTGSLILSPKPDSGGSLACLGTHGGEFIDISVSGYVRQALRLESGSKFVTREIPPEGFFSNFELGSNLTQSESWGVDVSGGSSVVLQSDNTFLTPSLDFFEGGVKLSNSSFCSVLTGTGESESGLIRVWSIFNECILLEDNSLFSSNGALDLYNQPTKTGGQVDSIKLVGSKLSCNKVSTGPQDERVVNAISARDGSRFFAGSFDISDLFDPRRAISVYGMSICGFGAPITRPTNQPKNIWTNSGLITEGSI